MTLLETNASAVSLYAEWVTLMCSTLESVSTLLVSMLKEDRKYEHIVAPEE